MDCTEVLVGGGVVAVVAGVLVLAVKAKVAVVCSTKMKSGSRRLMDRIEIEYFVSLVRRYMLIVAAMGAESDVLCRCCDRCLCLCRQVVEY